MTLLTGELALLGLRLFQQPLFAAVFLVQFLHLAADRVALGLQAFNGLLLGGKEMVDDQRWRNQIGVGLAVQHRLPALLRQQVHIVLHRLGPVVHQMLIDIVGVEQRRGPEGLQQTFGQGFDQRLGVVIALDAGQSGAVGFPPSREPFAHLIVERGKLGMAEDAWA